MRGGAKGEWRVGDVAHLRWVMDDMASSPWAGQRCSGRGYVFLVVDVPVARHGRDGGTGNEMWWW